MREATLIKIGAWTVTPALNLIETETQSVKIEPRAMDVLVCLAQHAGHVVSVEELITSVWKGVTVGDTSVYVAIKQLRGALDDPGQPTSHIETIPKRGYRLTVPVEYTAPLVAPLAASSPSSATIQAGRWARRWLGVAALLPALAIGLLILATRGGSSPRDLSIVVLPFANLSEDPPQQYFADGLTDQIRSVLARVRGLRMIGRTSSFSFKDRDPDLATIRQAFGAQYAVEGSVRKTGNRVRIAAQLIDTRTGGQLWSETYDRRLDDIFIIEDEVANSVANALQVTLRVGERARLPGMTRNAAAYEQYLRGRALYLQFRPASHRLAIEHLQRAVALDPTFTDAWAGLRNVYATGEVYAPGRAAEWQRKGAEALDRARALTPDSPAVLIQTSLDLMRRGEWLEAAVVHQRAVEAYERYGVDAEASAARGFLFVTVGRGREAVDAFERARAADPSVTTYAFGLATAHLVAGNAAAALAEIDRARDLVGFETRFPALGLVAALTTGERAEIRNRVALLSAVDPSRPLSRTLARYLDDRTAASAEIHRLAAATTDAREKSVLATWAAYYGEGDLALQLLMEPSSRLAITSGLWGPLVRDARSLPQFSHLVRAVGLIEYWRTHGFSDVCRRIGAADVSCN